jgi:GT2 family glycosyltransferase
MYQDGQSVICLSKTPKLFARMLQSSWPPQVSHLTEGILVNNAGSTALEEIAMEAQWLTLSPGQNLSFAAGNNLAARAAQYSHLVLVNDDTILNEDLLHQLWRYRRYPVVGCLINDSKGYVNHGGGVFAGIDPVHCGKLAHDAYTVPWVTFACVQINHRAWDEIGGMDEGYWYGHEDVDFCLRMMRDGLGQAIVNPEAVVIHDEHGTRNPAVDDDGTTKFHRDWPIHKIEDLRERGMVVGVQCPA